eukprot:4592975-Pyramimonas_sp.AAC.1
MAASDRASANLSLHHFSIASGIPQLLMRSPRRQRRKPDVRRVRAVDLLAELGPQVALALEKQPPHEPRLILGRV